MPDQAAATVHPAVHPQFRRDGYGGRVGPGAPEPRRLPDDTSVVERSHSVFRLFTLQTLKRLALPAGGVLVVALVAIQLIPFGHVTPNPPVRREPRWNSPQT